MASEVIGEALGYDELGVHRHLVVSERLRIRRRMLHLTQKEVVARLRRLGVATTNKSLSSLEHGAGLDVGKLPELAQALNCTLTYLVGLTDEPERWEPDGGTWPVTHRGAGTDAAVVPQATPRSSPRAAENTHASIGCPPILGPLEQPRHRG